MNTTTSGHDGVVKTQYNGGANQYGSLSVAAMATAYAVGMHAKYSTTFASVRMRCVDGE
jgi:hypothetical protein